MALEASFGVLATRLQAAQEAFSNLRVAVVEDGPSEGAPLLLDQLGDAVTDLLGWLEEAAEAAGEGVRQVRRPRDLERAQAALLTCHERWQKTQERLAADLLCCARIVEIHDLGRERGRAWRQWSTSVLAALDQGQDCLLHAGGALLDCWREIAERTETPAAAKREPAAKGMSSSSEN